MKRGFENSRNLLARMLVVSFITFFVFAFVSIRISFAQGLEIS